VLRRTQNTSHGKHLVPSPDASPVIQPFCPRPNSYLRAPVEHREEVNAKHARQFGRSVHKVELVQYVEVEARSLHNVLHAPPPAPCHAPGKPARQGPPWKGGNLEEGAQCKESLRMHQGNQIPRLTPCTMLRLSDNRIGDLNGSEVIMGWNWLPGVSKCQWRNPENQV
jgi:hypothetical protein